MMQQSWHIQPAPRTIYLLFLTQCVVSVCVGILFSEMVECRLFFRLLSHGIVSDALVDTSMVVNVASPAKSPSSSPETMHISAIIFLVNPFRQIWH